MNTAAAPGQKISYNLLYTVLWALLLAAFLLALRTGAVSLRWKDIVNYLGDIPALLNGKPASSIQESLFLQIRLPRILLCGMVGAALAVSGALMQALFRNPIVEPGLAGTSSGAALGAAVVFVLGAQFKSLDHTMLGWFILPLCAFGFSLAATWVVYSISAVRGHISVATMILVGVAMNAVTAGGTGFLSLIARDPQARSITFWSLGTFSGADWTSFFIVSVSTVCCVAAALSSAKGLNALLLGETEAMALGVNTARLKMRIIVINTLMVAVATAFVGVISFVGLVVPHILRLLKGSDNRYLIFGSALLGSSMLILADAAARTLIAPGEMPIGILTALVGAPVFIFILIRETRSGMGGGFYA